MKTIRMLADEVGGDGESLEKGSVYSLNDASADRWLRRGKAELALEEVKAEAPPEEKPAEVVPQAPLETTAADPVPRNKPGPKPKAKP